MNDYFCAIHSLSPKCTVVKTREFYLFLFFYKLYKIWYMLINDHPVLIHCIYILYIAFDHNRNNSYYNFKEINTAGPRLVSIFGNTRDHINILVKTNSYDIYF